MSVDDLLKIKSEMQKEFDEKRDLEKQEQRINIRLNALLKKDFEDLCRSKHSTISAEIKRFIVRCVESKSIK